MAMKPKSTMSMTDCPACNVLCIGPTILPCGHVVCRKCLVHLLAYRGQDPKCPSCLGDILHGKDHRQGVASVLASQFPKDTILEMLVDRELEKQDPVHCVGCENSLAVWICTDCAKYFCLQCGSTHRRSEQHELRLVPHELQNSSPVSAATSRPPSCSGHRDTKATSFCSIHNSPVCLKCVTGEHHACQVMRIDKALKVGEESFRRKIANLEKLLDDLQGCRTQTESIEDEICKTHQIAEQTTREAFKEMRTALDARENQLLEQLFSHAIREDDRLQEVKQCVVQKLKIVRKYSQGLQNLDDDVSLIFGQFQPRLDFLERDCRPPDLPSGCRLADLVLDSSDVERMKLEIAHLGQKTQSTRAGLNPQPSPENFVSKSEPTMHKKTSVRRTFCLSSQLTSDGDQETPWITSVVVTDKGQIIMADCWNSKIKALDLRSQGSVSATNLAVSPYGLAICHDGLLAVTSYNTNVIHLIDVIRQWRVVREIHTSRLYLGVGCGGPDGTLVVSCRRTTHQPASVDVISRDGQLLRTVVDGRVLSVLRSPQFLCVVGWVVVVSDWMANGIFRVDLETGQVVATHTSKHLQWPHQVTADSTGNVYVASWRDCRVLVMGVDGRWRTLLNGEEHGDGKCSRPRCVAVSDTGELVVVWSGAGCILTGFKKT